MILTDWYLPAVKAGGPVRSVSAIVDALKNDIEISVLTSDRDFGDETAFADIQPDVWLQSDGYRIQYISPAHLKSTIQSEVNAGYDKIYLNSLFSKFFTINALRAIKQADKKKVVIAPRGMLAEGALGLKSFKKKTFLRLAKTIGLYKSVSWHASTELETEEITREFSKAKVVAIENLIACKPTEFHSKDKIAGELKLVFVSRISPKKNLLFLLQVLNKVENKNICLDIYGPKEDEAYWSTCNEFIGAMPNVTYQGILQPNELQKVLKDYDLFVLPTLNENFGHIILESLSSSIPVLLSKNTPWLDLKEMHIGADLELDIDEWVNQLNAFTYMDSKLFESYRKSAWKFANKKMQQDDLMNQYLQLLG